MWPSIAVTRDPAMDLTGNEFHHGQCKQCNCEVVFIRKAKLELQSDWFKEARWPWLKDDRFYLRGINRNGLSKEVQPPIDGWRDGGAPIDWSPE